MNFNKVMMSAATGANNFILAGGEVPEYDTCETIHISPVALLKMLKHGRAGVPLEVMGLMLGEYVDEFTIHVLDVFAMPQTGTGVSVEAVDPVFQSTMLEMLAQVGRSENVVGWYHSHPGFGCWLSAVDVNTQKTFEMLNKRVVALVIDPIQSVKGSVVIDAFRLINGNNFATDSRQCTSNPGTLYPPTHIALANGLTRQYYSINIKYTLSDLERKVLFNLQQQSWINILHHEESMGAKIFHKGLADSIKNILPEYEQSMDEERGVSEANVKKSRKQRFVGKHDPRKQLYELSKKLSNSTSSELIKLLIDVILFKPQCMNKIFHDE